MFMRTLQNTVLVLFIGKYIDSNEYHPHNLHLDILAAT